MTDHAQLYTIEGVCAALIMLISAYMIVGATTMYTPGDAHISDMQLETLGTDALAVMDTAPNSSVAASPLEQIVENDSYGGGQFKSLLMNYTNVSGYGPKHDIQFSANYSYRGDSTNIVNVPINASRNLSGGEHVVRVTRWVLVNKKLPPSTSVERRAVLVEVFLWRD